MAAGDPRHLGPDDQARGHDAPGLARGAHRQFDVGRIGEADRARAPAGVHRARQEDQDRGRVRAAPLHPAQVDFECDLYAQGAQAFRLLPGVHLLPHHRLQGHVPGRPARHLLSRSARQGFRQRARARAPALLHQYLPGLVARASLPDDRAQRRDQHAARQRQLDGGAPGVGVLRPVRRRHQQAVADLLRGPVRYRLLRQCARIPGAGRLPARARDDDDDSGGLGGQPAHGRGASRLLRVQRRADGAVGRPGGDRLHQRPPDRRHPRPQRLAPGALFRHPRRPHHHGLRDGRAAHSGEGHRDEVAPAAGQDAARRSRPGPPHSRRGAQGDAGQEPPLQGVARTHADRARGIAGRGRQGGVVEPVAARSPADLRLHPGRLAHPDGADGEPGRGGRRLHGQRRADLGAVRQAQAALHLFQAELRPGDQPADRSDPRGTGHEPGLDHRAPAEPVRSRRLVAAQAPGSAPAHPHGRGSRKDPRHLGGRRRPFQVAHPRHHLAGRARRRRLEGGARHALRPRRGRRARRHQHHHPVGSPRRAGQHSDAVAARLRGGASPPHPPGPAHLGRARGRIRRTARSPSLRLPGRLRRGGDQPLSRLRDAAGDEGRSPAEARRVRDRQALHQVDRQGPAEGDVQDGHLHLPVLLRRADFRRRRPQVRFRRRVFHRHRDPHRRRGAQRDRRGDRAAAPRRLQRCSDLSRCARRRRRISVSRARRGPCVDRGHGIGAPARRARQPARPIPGLRQGQQRAVRAPSHHPRPVPAQNRRTRTAASRSRSRRSSRPRTSCAASPPAPCRSARSRAKPIPRSRSP